MKAKIIQFKGRRIKVDSDGTVAIKDLMVHPYNFKSKDMPDGLYHKDKNLIEKLAQSILKEGLKEALGVDIHGVTYSGNTRLLACILAGLERVKVVIVDEVFDPNTPKYKEKKILRKYNLLKTLSRPEDDLHVMCSKFESEWISYVDLMQIDIDDTRKRNAELKQFALEHSFDPTVLLAAYKIYAGFTAKNGTVYEARPDLIKKVDSKEKEHANYTLYKAKQEIEGKKENRKAIPNQYNMVEDFKNNPNEQTSLVKFVKDAIIHENKRVWEVNGEEVNWLHPLYGSSSPKIAAAVSEFSMQGLCASLNKIGIKTYTDAAKTNGADIYMVDKTIYVKQTFGVEFASETAEVKVGTHSGGDTIFHGGPGFKNYQHRTYYLLVATESRTSQIFMILGKVYGKDVNSTKDGCEMSLKKYLLNHENEDDFIILAGNINKNNDGLFDILFENIE